MFIHRLFGAAWVLAGLGMVSSAWAQAGAGETVGACCFSDPCQCLGFQSAEVCAAYGGVFAGSGSICDRDPCACRLRACCDTQGHCLGDVRRVDCASADRTWHPDASCGGTGLPRPICRPLDGVACIWDNGPPLQDGGAARAHTHAGGFGQLPRYDYLAADDFILSGAGNEPCSIDRVTTWMRMRPAEGGTALPQPFFDWLGANVTLFADVVSPLTGWNGPAGHGQVPAHEQDWNPKEAAVPGGIVYARHFPVHEGAVRFTFEDGVFSEYGPFCDPPPADGIETEHVYRVDVFIDPPILLGKNTRYWLSVQGVFPFNDGLRDTLQSWWMPSQHNTGFRGMTQRTNHPDYTAPNGSPIWVPNNVDLLPPGYPPHGGNAGNCPGAPPPQTRLDFAFELAGQEAPARSQDICQGAIEIWDGVTTFDLTQALTEGSAASCGMPHHDLWFRYTATCDGAIHVAVCGEGFDPVVSVHDGQNCQPPGWESACSNSACGSPAEALVRDTSLFRIRVGSAGPQGGRGTLTVWCEETCGSSSAGDCCTAHDPQVACDNAECCADVCATPFQDVCCFDREIGWDSECVVVAEAMAVCHCPCLHLCPAGAVAESETCGEDRNAGCSRPFGEPNAFEELGPIGAGSTRRACGTIYADDGRRDTDAWRFQVADGNGDGEVEIQIDLTANAPAGVLIVAEPEDSSCEVVTGGLPVAQLVLDSVATAACRPETLRVCVPADAGGTRYAAYVSTFATAGDGTLGRPLLEGIPCAKTSSHRRNNYSFALTSRDTCAPGACCTCVGGCLDGLSESECRSARGTFAGEGRTCTALSASGLCEDAAHGCASAMPMQCGETLVVDLTLLNRPPDELYPCLNSGASIDDSAWFHFVAPPGVHSARIHTCGSENPGRDSMLAVYSGTCCGLPQGLLPIACSDDECGFTGGLSHVCVSDLVPGETYYLQVSNANPQVNGRYELRLECPCSGSCCDAQSADCTDHAALESCPIPQRFHAGVTCADLNPRCGVGACCASDGSCSEVPAEECGGCAVHRLGASCDQTLCQIADSCRFATAKDLSTDRSPVSHRAQYASDVGLWEEQADDFLFLGCDQSTCPDSDPCRLVSMEYVVSHDGHDAEGGCPPGGGPVCTDTPADYEGILVTFSVGDDGPDCVPQCGPSGCEAGADGDFHEGEGCLHGVVLGAATGDDPPAFGSYWTFSSFGTGGDFLIRVVFDPPVALERSRRHWLALTHRLPQRGRYAVHWRASNFFNGTPPQAFRNEDGAGFSSHQSTGQDLLFALTGMVSAPGCGSCRLFGDHQPAFCRIDVDDVICVLDGFVRLESCPSADQYPCGGDGVMDVDDILTELGAFIGDYACPHPCSGGACCAVFRSGVGEECRDMNYFPGGMSRTDCFMAGGTYQCDGSTCPQAECVPE